MLICPQIFQMRLEESWDPLGATTFYARGQVPDGGTNGSGEGDSTGGALTSARRSDDWPTLVIEASVLQSLALLREDVRWWFSASGRGVKIVLLIKFSQGLDRLVLEKWEEEELLAPPGPLTRSRARQCGKRSRLVETGQMPSHTRSLGGRWCSGSSFCFCEIRIRISGRGTLSLAFPALQRYAKHICEIAVRD